MHVFDTFPTKFAQAICGRVGLFGIDCKNSNGAHNKEDMKWYFGLTEFQQMIVGGAEFEDALLAYHGTELSEEQLAVLRIVERSTRPWVLGHIAGILTEKLSSSNGKDFLVAAQIILQDLMGSEGDGEGGGPSKETVKSLIIKLAPIK